MEQVNSVSGANTGRTENISEVAQPISDIVRKKQQEEKGERFTEIADKTVPSMPTLLSPLLALQLGIGHNADSTTKKAEISALKGSKLQATHPRLDYLTQEIPAKPIAQLQQRIPERLTTKDMTDKSLLAALPTGKETKNIEVIRNPQPLQKNSHVTDAIPVASLARFPTDKTSEFSANGDRQNLTAPNHEKLNIVQQIGGKPTSTDMTATGESEALFPQFKKEVKVDSLASDKGRPEWLYPVPNKSTHSVVDIATKAALPMGKTDKFPQPQSGNNEIEGPGKLTYRFKQWGEGHHVNISTQTQNHSAQVVFQPSDATVQQRLGTGEMPQHWSLLRDGESQQQQKQHQEQPTQDEEEAQ
ncbi:hypothetical protein PL78_18140 [Yersinia entomophaga]|uniref:Surface presentation of antigen domain-containing protein n=1 Tax=Yersinia entomophaga TaxID=935293 RepID=A0ABN4PXJ9_YERET|nr:MULTISPECIES: type III secretion system needle length determinant, SpaN/EivJ family [Yersinia]ANI31728.1 hypothetical protein PL78_18140 [Yersinia entomophaga]OWF85428.1 hypothetical protein B4914_17495 [Yersinia entomophaga]